MRQYQTAGRQSSDNLSYEGAGGPWGVSERLAGSPPGLNIPELQSSLGRQDSTGAFVFDDSPLGFITSPISRTDFDSHKTITEFFKKVDRQIRFFAYRRLLSQNTFLRNEFLQKYSIRSSSTVGFKVRQYRSGEVTGGLYHTGREGKYPLSGRSGKLVTEQLSYHGRQKIRRSVECSESLLKYFCTLTFALGELQEWHKNEDGTVRHDFAKYKIRKFLNTCSHKQSRLKRELNYLWTAELQENGNIHFHILWDKFFDIKWLTKIWAQASNSVDIKRLKNAEHAANYMTKYMSKACGSAIEGNRYFISHKLSRDAVPKEIILLSISKKENEQDEGATVKEFMETLRAMREDIESRGGRVLDFGFHVARPRSAKKYKDKETGEEKESRAVSPLLGKQIISLLACSGGSGNLPF